MHKLEIQKAVIIVTVLQNYILFIFLIRFWYQKLSFSIFTSEMVWQKKKKKKKSNTCGLSASINPCLTKLFFVARLIKGGGASPSLDFRNQTPYEFGFGINR